jgi:polyhydroxyalkanoate synthesis regulator phasin
MSIGGEKAQRELASNMEQYSRAMEESVSNMGDMTPEEAGRAVGEFMKGLEDAAKEGEKAGTD